MDYRRRDRYERQSQHFKTKVPRIAKDSKRPSKLPITRKHTKEENIALANETLVIINNLMTYRSSTGQQVPILKALHNIKTFSYPPNYVWPDITSGQFETEFEVILETTLQGCARMSAAIDDSMKLESGEDTNLEKSEHPIIGCLNFASAKNPGGGFLRGTMAQEESIAYSSALYLALKDNPMYNYNRDNLHDGLYSDYMIISHQVPVFRNDNRELLDKPYNITFLTVPAVNAGIARSYGITEDVITKTMKQRADKLLAMAYQHNIEILILGSWGCGVFQNDIEMVAGLFVELLTTKYNGCFKQVVFSILDPEHLEIFKTYF